MREIEAQAKALAPILKAAMETEVEKLRKEFSALLEERDAKIRELTEALQQIPKFSAEDVAREAAALVEKPKDGKDADPEEIQRLVETAFAGLPWPKDGKSVDPKDVVLMVNEAVLRHFDAIRLPKDGKDYDPEVLRQAVADEVAKIPVPKDGQSGTIKDVLPAINEEITRQVGELPKPKDGESVPVEQVRKMVDEAVQGRMAGIQLPKDGEPGRDAAHIEILPAINPEKSYPRGTYAKHAGGLWRSYEATSGMKGWECIVEGVASMRIEQEGERGFKAVSELSSGTTEENSIMLPAMIYRGIFQPSDFQPGDTVTWGGSLWHCDEPTSDKPGEPGCKGWTLAAKRGRDGKDGLNGKDLVSGVKRK